MARHYSDHFHASGVVSTLAGTLPLDNSVKIDAGRSGAPRLTKRAHVNIGTAAAIGDEIRLCQIKSGARIYEARLISDGGATAGAADLGLYKSGANHDGAVIDADLFGSALATSGAITYANSDAFIESTNLTDQDRGKYLWELADLGAGTYTKDPVEQWEFVLTVTTAFTVAVTDMVLIVTYTD